MATPPFLPNETKPGASDLVSLFPAVEQTFRDVIEDWILWEHNTGGTHKQVTLDDIAEPTIPADMVGIWHESGVLKTRFATNTVYEVLTSSTGIASAGGTMTGDLVLAGAPDADLKAATKAYVDAHPGAGAAPLDSPLFTGNPRGPTPSASDNDTSLATTAFVNTAISAAGPALFHVRDEKSSGADGGTFTSGSWRKRTLNTTKTNDISGASLSSSVITLPAGTYYIEANAPAYGTNDHQAKLRNTSAGSDTIIGHSARSRATSVSVTESLVIGRFTITGTKSFELQHRCELTIATVGFGSSVGFGVKEVYADVRIWKVS